MQQNDIWSHPVHDRGACLLVLIYIFADSLISLEQALDSYGKTTDAPGYVSALLHGVSKGTYGMHKALKAIVLEKKKNLVQYLLRCTTRLLNW